MNPKSSFLYFIFYGKATKPTKKSFQEHVRFVLQCAKKVFMDLAALSQSSHMKQFTLASTFEQWLQFPFLELMFKLILVWLCSLCYILVSRIIKAIWIPRKDNNWSPLKRKPVGLKLFFYFSDFKRENPEATNLYIFTTLWLFWIE